MDKKIISDQNYKWIRIFLINYFIFSFIFCFIYLIAPLLGGILSVSSAVYFISHSGMAVFCYWILKNVYNLQDISPAVYSVFVAYSLLCTYLWFEPKTAAIISVVYFFFSLFGYMKYK